MVGTATSRHPDGWGWGWEQTVAAVAVLDCSLGLGRGVHLLTRFWLAKSVFCARLLLCPFLIFSSLPLCAGQGTFGKVKLAQNTESGIEYAIKILDKSDIKANELTVNVRREVRMPGRKHAGGWDVGRSPVGHLHVWCSALRARR